MISTATFNRLNFDYGATGAGACASVGVLEGRAGTTLYILQPARVPSPGQLIQQSPTGRLTSSRLHASTPPLEPSTLNGRNLSIPRSSSHQFGLPGAILSTAHLLDPVPTAAGGVRTRPGRCGDSPSRRLPKSDRRGSTHTACRVLSDDMQGARRSSRY